MFEGHSGIYVRVIADSIHPLCANPGAGHTEYPGRITTIEMKYPRWIHSEFMTHRDRSRNAASSRAVSVKKSLENCQFMPFKIQAEQKGMQGGDEIPDADAAREVIAYMREEVLQGCHKLVALGVHKGIVNRYLEPWAHITVVQTSCFWNNYLAQRDHPKAEQHFQELARLTRLVLEDSVPVERNFHLPYVSQEEMNGFTSDELMRLSAARCAGVSYQRAALTAEKEIELGQKLIDETPPHSSPLEHPCTSLVHKSHRIGCHKGWKSLRYIVGQGV